MTEQEWLASTNPRKMSRIYALDYLDRMLVFLDDCRRTRKIKRGGRKLRLVACGWCRRYWHLLDKQSRAAVELAERFADGLETRQQRHHRWQEVRHPDPGTRLEYTGSDLAECVLEKDELVAAMNTANVCYSLYWQTAGTRGAWWMDVRQEVALVHDVFGNPFRPVKLASRWRTGVAVALARTAYEDHRFEDLPLLADALEEAGCADDAILSHCRGPGPHVRGCWVIDLVLGKS